MRMTTDEKYMRAALKQAEKAYNLGETPIGCVIVHEDKIIARVITDGIQTRIHWHMLRLQQSRKQAKSLVTGVWKNVHCM